MMLAALKLTLRPSIALASSLALSSQWSARAGEAASAANSARVAGRIDRRSGRRNVMVKCPREQADIEAADDASRKSAAPAPLGLRAGGWNGPREPSRSALIVIPKAVLHRPEGVVYQTCQDSRG